MPWLIDSLAGLVLAALLYGLVRFRMYFAPIMRDRYGAWARWTTWVVVVIVMVGIANLELVWLRPGVYITQDSDLNTGETIGEVEDSSKLTAHVLFFCSVS